MISFHTRHIFPAGCPHPPGRLRLPNGGRLDTGSLEARRNEMCQRQYILFSYSHLKPPFRRCCCCCCCCCCWVRGVSSTFQSRVKKRLSQKHPSPPDADCVQKQDVRRVKKRLSQKHPSPPDADCVQKQDVRRVKNLLRKKKGSLFCIPSFGPFLIGGEGRRLGWCSLWLQFWFEIA